MVLRALFGLVVFGDVVEDYGGFTVYGGELDFEGFVAVGAVVDVFFGLSDFFAAIDTVHNMLLSFIQYIFLCTGWMEGVCR